MLGKRVAGTMTNTQITILISKQRTGQLYARTGGDDMLNGFYIMQHRTKKKKKKNTVEPSNDGISPFPACSSIPEEENRQFKYRYKLIQTGPEDQ